MPGDRESDRVRDCLRCWRAGPSDQILDGPSEKILYSTGLWETTKRRVNSESYKYATPVTPDPREKSSFLEGAA